MLFEDLDNATRLKAIAFLEASLEEEMQPRRKVLHLTSASHRRAPRLAEQSEQRPLKRCA